MTIKGMQPETLYYGIRDKDGRVRAYAKVTGLDPELIERVGTGDASLHPISSSEYLSKEADRFWKNLRVIDPEEELDFLLATNPLKMIKRNFQNQENLKNI